MLLCRLETGDVYAIDMGGTNFRVMHVQLSEDRSKVVSEAGLCQYHMLYMVGVKCVRRCLSSLCTIPDCFVRVVLERMSTNQRGHLGSSCTARDRDMWAC